MISSDATPVSGYSIPAAPPIKHVAAKSTIFQSRRPFELVCCVQGSFVSYQHAELDVYGEGRAVVQKQCNTCRGQVMGVPGEKASQDGAEEAR